LPERRDVNSNKGVSALTPVLELKHVSKVYRMGNQRVRALQDVSLSVNKGEFLSILGPSGSGKTTLLQIAGCLDRPTSGTVWIEGTNVTALDEKQLAIIRGQKLGFVFQHFNLLPQDSALNNVELPLQYSGIPAEERRRRAMRALAEVGLEDRIHHRPNELSGGQRQRVAIARALVNDPAIILADEPTGALDTKTGGEVMRLLQDLNEKGRTILMVTHNQELAAQTKRIVKIVDGRIVSDKKVKPKRARLPKIPPPDAEGPVCPRCNWGNRPGSKYCAQCGFRTAPLDASTTERLRMRLSGIFDMPVTCARCGALNRSISKYCAQCGTPMLGF